MKKCDLCKIDLNNPKERIWYADKNIVILDTKERKGHDVRLMIMSKRHIKKYSTNYQEWSMNKFLDVLKLWKFIDFTIWKGDNAKVKNHWHKVASCICFFGVDNKLKEQETTLDFLQTPVKIFEDW